MARSTALDAQLRAHLLRRDGQEDIAFVTWRPSTGRTRTTAVLREVLLPEDGDRQVHGNASFNQQYFLRALDHAIASDSGLALVHSHPRGRGWQGLSPDDAEAEAKHAAATQAATGLPLVGMTMGGADGTISARRWVRTARDEYVAQWADQTRLVGHRFRVDHRSERMILPGVATHDRTVSAWGPDVHRDITRMRVGVVGLGSVGAQVAENLARMGVGEVVLIDFDTLQIHNLDRTLHATRLDVACKRGKSEVAARALRRDRPSLDTTIRTFEHSIVERTGLAAALDCDVLFSCVDRPWAREVLNTVAYGHLIPVVDGGVNVPPRGPRWMGVAVVGAHVAAPGRRCLACLEQYLPSDVQVERDGSLDDPTYLAGLPDDHRLKLRQNVFGFATQCAALEIGQFMAMVAGPNPVLPAQRFNFGTGTIDATDAACEEYCEFPDIVAAGDRAAIAAVDVHEAAETQRRGRADPVVRLRLLRAADDILHRAHLRLANWVTK